MRLGTLLLRDSVITLTQLEQALRAQILSGGRLGTNLVELGFLDVNTLGRYLARILDVPVATTDQFESVTPKTIQRLDKELANKYSVVPLGVGTCDSAGSATTDELDLAMMNPTDETVLCALQETIGCPIRPHVTAELRLVYYLERFYGIKRQTRFIRDSRQTDSRAPERERRATQPFRGGILDSGTSRRRRQTKTLRAGGRSPSKPKTLPIDK